MEDNTNYTEGPEENLLGLIDSTAVNEIEAEGILTAESMVYEMDIFSSITPESILALHEIAFKSLYGWAGKWRTIQVSVGKLNLPEYYNVPNLMYQFLDNLNFKISIASNIEDHIECIAYAHYEFVKIHPFNNGNGRLGRIVMNLVALKFGYQFLELYKREGDSRKVYINALRNADSGDFTHLYSLIREELRHF
jgi:cell filamentation protein